MSSEFFFSAYNLRKPEDSQWRTFLHLSWSRQLSAGKHSIPNAHSPCLLLPAAAHTWHRPLTLMSALLQDCKPHWLPRFSEPSYRLLIHLLNFLSKQFFGLQDKTGVAADYCQVKEAQLWLHMHLTKMVHVLINLGWNPVFCLDKCRAKTGSPELT